MSTTTQFIVPFLIGSFSILILGLFAMWAEFKSAGKKNEYTRYKHVPTFTFESEEAWMSKIKHYAKYGKVDSNGFAMFHESVMV